MKNRLITPPEEKSNALNKSFDLSCLKGKFSAKRLFRSYYYDLITGKLSVLDNVTNKWLTEQIIEYSLNNSDINLIPALKKIAGDARYDESTHQRASEVMEIIEEFGLTGTIHKRQSDNEAERERVIKIRRIFSDERYPQTAEVLRLLRDKSPEIKRLGLYIICKFRMKDLLLEVCECLNIPGIKEDAFSVLLSFGSEAGNELRRFYLASSGNPGTSRTIIRLLGKVCDGENTSFLFSRIWSNSRQIKENALRCLVDCGFKAPENEKDRLQKLIYDIFGLLAWIISAKVCLDKNIDNLLFREMDKEYNRWKTFLYYLINMIPHSESSSGKEKEDKVKSDYDSLVIRKMIEIVFHDSRKPKYEVLDDIGSDKRVLKKLNRFFPVEIPKYKELLEDLINRDYNIINIWVKVCTLRNLAEIDDENIAESVVALLFSPEEILQEEAARLIARSGMELYKTASERIPEITRNKLNRIVSAETNEKELLFQKVRFLKSCFSETPEEDLIFLGSRLLYFADLRNGTPAVEGGNILWLMSEENPIPMVYVNHPGIERIIKGLNRKSHNTFGYALPFSAIEEYHFEYPEKSFEIFKYIDINEE